jgi:cytochrome c oxidase cbb3-type subunit III
MVRPAGTLLAKTIVFAALVAAGAACASAQIQQLPVDETAANRGQQVFASTCGQCHGADARGTASGPDLIRSLPVLHDRAQQLHGTDLLPLLQKPNHTFNVTQAQVADISQFLTRAINRTLRSGGYYHQPSNLLSGDAKAGEAFFNGAGGCNKCHSATGDLAGVANRYDPAALQQKSVFPQAGFGRARGGAAAPKPQVTVTEPSGQTLSGDLVRIDDFNVTLIDASGERRTLTRLRGMKVEVTDPYAAHVTLLGKYTNADIHNLTAYLETLK